jgi:hypothetical protein
MRIGSAKQSYAADAALFDTPTQRAWLAVLVVALAGFPVRGVGVLAVPGLPGRHQPSAPPA